MLFIEASLFVKHGICFISLTISSRLGARGTWEHGGDRSNVVNESLLSYVGPVEGSPSSR